VCVCVCWRNVRNLFGKYQTQWDFSDLILNPLGTHLASQSFMLSITCSAMHSIYIFDKVLVFFLCNMSQIVHKWFVVSLMVWCFQIHASHALERDLLVSSCETFPLSTGLLGMTCDIWETFTFVGCDVCWILLNSKDF